MQGGRLGGRKCSERKVRLAVALALFAATGASSACGKAGPDRKQLCDGAARDSIAALLADLHAHATEASLGPAERANVEARNNALEAVAPRFEAILRNHCIDDAWPSASIECYRKAASYDAMRACRDALPGDAQTKLQTDELALIGGAGAAPSPAMSPPGLAGEALPRAPMTQAEHDAAVAEANALAQQMTELGAKINEASKQLAAATDANRAAAKAELDALTKQADELRAKLAAAQSRAR